MKDKRRRQQKGTSTTKPRRTPTTRIVVLLGAAVLGSVGWWLYADRFQQATGPPDPNAFQPTVENARLAPGAAPSGMVWIPGGEFSMGAAESPDMNDGRHAGDHRFPADSPRLRRRLLDGRHRGHQRRSSRRSSRHRLRDHRRARAARRGLSRRAAGEPRGRLGRLLPARPRRAAERSLSMVVVREGRRLAASGRAREQPRRPRAATRWSRSRTTTPWRTRRGRASGCRPKRSGSSRREAG